MSFKCMNDAKVVDGQHLLRLIRAGRRRRKGLRLLLAFSIIIMRATVAATLAASSECAWHASVLCRLIVGALAVAMTVCLHCG